MNKHNWQRRIVLLIGIVLSLLFLWLALRKFELQSLSETFSTVHYIPLVLCAVAVVVSIFLRAIRWRIIAGCPPIERHNFSRATKLGALANLIFPARAGELIRIATLANLSGMSLAKPLASAVIDRLIDILVLIISATFLYWLLPVSAILGKWLLALFFTGGVITLTLVLYSRSSGIGEASFFRLINRWLQRWSLNPDIFLSELRSEFRRIFNGWLSIEILSLASLILLVDYSGIATLLLAFNLSLPPEAPLFLLVFLAAGSALPSAPSYVGIYQAAAVWSLSYYNVSATTAVSVATILQVTTLTVVLILAGPGSLRRCRQILFQKNTINDKNIES